MDNREPLPKPAKLLKKYIWVTAVFWTMLMFILVAWDLGRIQDHTEHMMRKEARVHFKWMNIFRAWNASHGGVYVPVTERTPPNPYLKIDERDITTPSGKALTLMNPAYMTRMVYENYEDQAGIIGHITSLKPLNPDNAPDNWERAALVEFDGGVKEKMELTEIGGKPYLRLIKPLFIKEECLKCHSGQGYKVGDVRGGITVSVPTESYIAYKNKEVTKQIVGSGVVWVLGLIGLGVASRGLSRQVREREKISTALRESEERYRLIIEGAKIIAWELDPYEGIFTFVSGQAEKILGYQVERWYEKGFWESHIYQEDREDTANFRANAFKRGEDHDFEYRMVAADGQVVWLRDIVQVIKKDGRPTSMRGIMIDITELKQAEDNLSKSNRMLKMLSDCNEALIRSSSENELLKEICEIIVNVGGYRFAWVGYAERDEYKSVRQVAQYGFEKEYVQTTMISWADTEQGRGPTGMAIRNGVTSVVNNIQTDPGYEPWRESAMKRGYNSSAAFPLFIDGQAIGALNVYSSKVNEFDENEIALLEDLAADLSYGIASLRAREERLRLFRAIEHSAETVVITDIEGNISYVNPAFEAITGYTREEAIGQNPRIINSGRQDEAFYKNMWTTIKGGKVWTGHFINKRKDGSYYEENATISPVLDSQGNITGFVAVKRDVTSESALAKARDYFTSVTSHELRTPLTRLDLVKMLLKRLSESPLDKKILEKAETALGRSIDDFSRIVSTGEMFTDLKLERTKQNFHDYSLRMIVSYSVEKVKMEMEKEERDVQLDMEMESIGQEMNIRCDQNMLAKAFEEVLSNAVKYTPDGESVTVTGNIESDKAVVRIKNEGAGMTEGDKDVLFEPFFSLEDVDKHTTSRYKYRGGGIGMGLTLVRLIMEYHDGEAEAYSEGEGKGVSVALKFPLSG